MSVEMGSRITINLAEILKSIFVYMVVSIVSFNSSYGYSFRLEGS